MEAAIGSSGLVNVVALCRSLRQASYNRGLIRAESAMTTPKGNHSAMKSKQTSPENFPNLPQDIIADILVRLPVKLIGRCKCLSKPWRSFLSSPHFIKSLFKFHINDPNGLAFTGSYNLLDLWCRFSLTMGSISNGDGGSFCREVKLPFEKSSHFLVQGSCCGLILLQLIDFERLLPVIVMDPITLEYVNVPEDPNARYCTYGYDSSKDDYKVISLSCVKGFSVRLLEIYSLKTKTWRRVGNFPYGIKEISYIDLSCTSSGVFVNGRFHWINKIVNSHYCVIDAFSLASEKFEEVPLPRGVGFNKKTSVDITSLGGCLAVMKGLGTCRVVIWLMKEYGVQDSWTILTMNCPEKIQEVVCILSDNEIVIKDGGHEQLIAYNWKTGVSRNMNVAGVPQSFGGVLNFRFGGFLAFHNSDLPSLK